VLLTETIVSRSGMGVGVEELGLAGRWKSERRDSGGKGAKRRGLRDGGKGKSWECGRL